MELRIIEWIQENFFDYLIYILSYGGHLFVLLGVIMVTYLAVNKRLGGKLFIFYFVSMGINAFAKVWFGRGRPYTKGANTIIEKSLQHSMPSGHAQGFTSFLSPIAFSVNTKKAYMISSILLLFLGFTRIYLGQHYPSDILVGICFGIIIAFLLELLYRYAKGRVNAYLFAFIPIFGLFMIVFNSKDYRDAFVSCGLLTGGIIGMYFENRYVGYEISGSLANRILKVLFALIVTSIVITPAVLLRAVVNENIFIFILFILFGLSITFISPYFIKLLFSKKLEVNYERT